MFLSVPRNYLDTTVFSGSKRKKEKMLWKNKSGATLMAGNVSTIPKLSFLLKDFYYFYIKETYLIVGARKKSYD